VVYPLLAVSIRTLIGARRVAPEGGRAAARAARLLKIAMPAGLLAFLLEGVGPWL